MAWYSYASQAAFDPTTREVAPLGSVGQVYAVSDTAYTTPIPTFDLSGLPVELAAGEHGFLPSFQVEDQVELKWKSGDYVFHLNTTTPLVGPAGPAVESAAVAGDQLTFTLENGVTLNPVSLPTGPGGSDAGVAGYVSAADSLTRAALDAEFRNKGEWFADVRDYKQASDPDDAAAITAAHAANPAVFYPDGNYVPGATNNL